MASTDPVAIDQACYDLIKNTNEEGTKPFLDQVERLLGLNTIQKAEALGVGNTKYNLINIDGDDNNPGAFIAWNFSLILLMLLMFI